MVDSLVRETICVERIECLENTAMDYTVWKKYGISPCAIMSGLMNELLSHDMCICQHWRLFLLPVSKCTTV